MRKSIFIFIVGMLLASCNQRPKNILDEKTMVSIMADLQLAEASRQGDGYRIQESSRAGNDMGSGILAYYGVSQEKMDSTLAWYGRNMDQYAKLYKKVDEELVRRQRIYAKAAGETDDEMSGSSDLWPYGRHAVISNHSLTDGLVVSLPGDELLQGDRLIWKLRTPGGMSSREMMLGVDYTDGTSSVIRQSMRGDQWNEISLQTDSTLGVARIFGVFKADVERSALYVDSIQLVHLPLNFEEYHRINYQKRIGKPMRKTAEEADSDSIQTISSELSVIETSALHRTPASVSKGTPRPQSASERIPRPTSVSKSPGQLPPKPNSHSHPGNPGATHKLSR